jgi:hypothetical protein
MSPTAKLRAPQGWTGVEVVTAPGDDAVEVVWHRGARARFLSWPWRPLHHQLVWRIQPGTDIRWEFGPEDDGLYLLVDADRWPDYLRVSRGADESYRIDVERLLVELTVFLAAAFATVVIGGLPW